MRKRRDMSKRIEMGEMRPASERERERKKKKN